MVKITRKLTVELHQPAATPCDLEKASCALKQRLSCCDGIGYRLIAQGAYAYATLCDCIKSCPTCFGRVRHLQEGVSISCREPSPARIVNLLNAASIPARYTQARFDQFSNFSGNGRDIMLQLRHWLKEYDERQGKGFIIGGPVGVGKTYLLCALAKNLAAKGHSVRFVDFFQLLNELKSAYASNKADDSVLQPLMEVDVLIIDEMGKGRNSDWEISVLDQLVMGRYNQNKAIIASTNYDLKADTRRGGFAGMQLNLEDHSSSFQLNGDESLQARVGERIFSRLTEMCHMLELKGEDFRRQTIQPPKAAPRRPEAPRGVNR